MEEENYKGKALLMIITPKLTVCGYVRELLKFMLLCECSKQVWIVLMITYIWGLSSTFHAVPRNFPPSLLLFCNFLTLHENIITAPRLLLSKGPFNLDISATLPNYQTFPHSFFSIFSPSPRYHAIAAEIISTETCCVYDCKTKKISSSLFYYGLQFTISPHTTHRMTISTSSTNTYIQQLSSLSTPRYHVEFLGRFYIFVLFIPMENEKREKSLCSLSSLFTTSSLSS